MDAKGKAAARVNALLSSFLQQKKHLSFIAPTILTQYQKTHKRNEQGFNPTKVLIQLRGLRKNFKISFFYTILFFYSTVFFMQIHFNKFYL